MSQHGSHAEGKNTSVNGSRTLTAYFSLRGNTDYADDVDAALSARIVADIRAVWYTEYVANMIGELTGGEIYLIQTDEKYSADFDQVVSQNHSEMD